MKTKKKKQNILVSVLVLAAVILVMTACGTLPEAEEKKPLETKNLAELMQGDKTETGKLVSMDGKTEKTAEEIAEEIGYMSFGKITAEGYYPDWMQPDSRIEYDENGVPKITEGGELLPQDLLGREEFSSGFPFTSVGSGIVTMMIQPNTVVEYNRNGALQNIYYVWPDGSLNLSPYSAIEVPEELIEVPEFIWPCEETDLNAVVGSYNGHTGIDIGHTHGAEIYASREGVVTEVDIGKKGYGYYVVIDHGEGFSTLYAHCSKILVEMGQKVEAGETIALTGSTGNSTGNHLHFELHYNGGIIDPQYLLVKD